MRLVSNRSHYITNSASIASPRNNNVIFGIFTSILSILVLIGLLFTTLGNGLIAYADEEESKREIAENANEYIVKDDEGEGNLSKTLTKAGNDDDPNSFGYIINRLFSTNYLNETPKSSTSVPKGGNCQVNHEFAGTPLYHNCDVPNIFTEFIQDALSTLTQSGPEGAEKTSVKLDVPQFGLPTDIPGNGAPVNPDNRQAKYTALELFGYNLQYTQYKGEWDHIKVMTGARSMSNFGFMDNLKLSVSTVFNGIATGIGQGATNFISSLSSGDIFGALGGLFTSTVESGASAAANTVLDTSDQNIFNTYSWYRIGYGGTLYNAREMTGEEIAAFAKAQLLNMILKSEPDEAQTPEDLQSIQGGLPDPKEAVSKCMYKTASGNMTEFGRTNIAPGVSESACRQQAERAAEIANNNAEEDDDEVEAEYEWDAEGTQELETIEKWVENNSEILGIAEKYNMGVEIDTNEANRATTVATVKASWLDKWDAARIEYLMLQQETLNTEWMNEQLSPELFSNYVTEDPSRNYNAPWNRFVCTDSDGVDLRDGNGNRIMLYDYNGNLNDACKEVRAPIQNGFFGNGYTDQTPPQDTRNAIVDTSVFSSLLAIDSFFTAVANIGLWLAVMATRVSNTVINLAFSPILSTLGIDTIVINVIESFRDGIFFPLLLIGVGIAGVMALWSAGKNRDYGRQAVSLLLMALTIITGTFLMFLPEKMVQVVDEVPSAIERTILGNIFSIGNTTVDNLCTATGSSPGVRDTDLEGKVLPYSASEGTRSLLCENWRTFALNPWVYGQFGTNLDSLYAAETNRPNAMRNTNGDLVGDAAVYMGGNITMNNWAMYQLDTMSAGTASFVDTSAPTGTVDSNFYRIVDMQAGPNNGAGTDNRFFNMWSGSDPGARLTVGLVSPIVAALGAFTVIVYSFAKIQITFVVTFMLMILPIMFLYGVHPTQGRLKLKAYAGSLIGLMIQRVVLVLLLAVMLRVLSGIGSVTTDYLLLALLSIVICVAFLSFRKPLHDLIFGGVSRAMGRPVGERFMTDPRGVVGDYGVKPPSSVRNWAELQRTGLSSAATGAIAGFVTGGISGAKSGARENAEINTQRLRNQQRGRGYGAAQTVVDASRIGKESAVKEVDKNAFATKVKDDIAAKHQENRDYEEALALWKELPKENIDGKNVAVDPVTGEKVAKPVEPSIGVLNEGRSASENRRLAKMGKAARAVAKKDIKRRKKNEELLDDNLMVDNVGKVDFAKEARLNSEQAKKERADGAEELRQRKLGRTSEKLDKNIDKMTEKYSQSYNSNPDAKMKKVLDDLRTRAENHKQYVKKLEEEEYFRKAEENYYREVLDDDAYVDYGDREYGEVPFRPLDENDVPPEDEQYFDDDEWR